jgi:hypothetical protein
VLRSRAAGQRSGQASGEGRGWGSVRKPTLAPLTLGYGAHDGPAGSRHFLTKS